MSHSPPTTRSGGSRMELDLGGSSCGTVSLTPARKSHDRKRPEGHIPRPPNAFLLYRCDFLRKRVIPRSVEAKQYNISIVVGECWRRLTTEEREVWQELAREKEKEHAMKYPGYQYKPSKRGEVQRRRKTMTREEEIDHCETLRTTYFPDKTGPVIQPPTSTPRRKRKSRAKVHAVAKEPSPVEPKKSPSTKSGVSAPTPSFEVPAFTEPLLPPPQVQAPDSGWKKQSPEVAWTSHAVLDPDLEPTIYFDFPAALSPDNEMETDDLWSQESVLQSPPQESMPIREPVSLNAATHIREKYDIARRGAMLPTPSMDYLEAQAIFEPQPFFAPSTLTDAAYPITPEAQEISSPDGVFSNFLFPQFDYPPSPSNHMSNRPPGQSDTPTPLPLVPQHFPMSLEVSGTMDPLRLQPPTFRSASVTHNLDSLTVSLDFSKLAKLEGVDGPSNLFGEIDEFGLGGRTGLGPMEDLLNADVCSREE